MNFFRRPDYRSEITQFLDHLKAQQPELEARQREGRELLWDKNLVHSEQAGFKAGKVAQKPYVYLTENT
jgi:hypothetical protein